MSSIHEADEDDQVAVDDHQPGRGPCFRQLGRCMCFEAGGRGGLILEPRGGREGGGALLLWFGSPPLVLLVGIDIRQKKRQTFRGRTEGRDKTPLGRRSFKYARCYGNDRGLNPNKTAGENKSGRRG